MKCLLLNNNRIVRIGESLELNLPRLDTLMLTNNSIQVGGVDTNNLIMLHSAHITSFLCIMSVCPNCQPLSQELADLEPLTSVKSLTMLSLLHNPVVTRRNYREYVIHKFPNLRVLDFKKVKDKEKEAAKKLFKTKEGKTQLKDISRKAKTFTPGDALPEATNKTTNSAGLTPEQVRLLP